MKEETTISCEITTKDKKLSITRHSDGKARLYLGRINETEVNSEIITLDPEQLSAIVKFLNLEL
jgi:hypothetical protein